MNLIDLNFFLFIALQTLTACLVDIDAVVDAETSFFVAYFIKSL